MSAISKTGVDAARIALLCVALAEPVGAAVQSFEVLRVCADPDNMPFSNEALQGFDNRIAALIATTLHTRLEYSWGYTRRGFLRQTFAAGNCDVVMGMPMSLPGLALTRPYYATSYAFVYAASTQPGVDNFDDARLGTLRIGLHAISVGGSNPPPARSLSARGLQGNMVGYSPWGGTGETNAQGRVVDAVAAGEVDVAIVWGPIAGYFAKQYGKALAVKPVITDARLPDLPYAHTLSIAVRDSDPDLKRAIDEVLDTMQQPIRAILAEYDIPITTAPIAQTVRQTQSNHH